MVNDSNKTKSGHELGGLDEATSGPKTYHIDEETLTEIKTDLSYRGIEKIVLLVEDDDVQRENIRNIATRYFSDDSTTSLCVASNVTEAEAHLKKYQEFSPDALMYGVLDYNMGESEPGQRRPTEALFHGSDVFQHYLGNGGVLIYNTGFPEQVKQSEVIMDAQRKYENLLMLITVKDPKIVKTETVVRFLSNVKPDKIPRLRGISEDCSHDLVAMIKTIRGKR
jgi:hypothetical protein